MLGSSTGGGSQSTTGSANKAGPNKGALLPIHAVSPPLPAADVASPNATGAPPAKPLKSARRQFGMGVLRNKEKDAGLEAGAPAGSPSMKKLKKGAVSPRIAFETPDEDDRPLHERAKGWAMRIFYGSTRYATNVFQLDGSDGSASAAASSMSAQRQAEEEDGKEKWAVERTIVDWDEAGHRHRDTSSAGGNANTTTGTASNTGGANSHPASSRAGSIHSGHGDGSRGTGHRTRTGGVHFSSSSVLHSFVRQVQHACWGFFDPRFEDAEEEEAYQKMAWQASKKLAFLASLYLVLDWILYLVFNHSETTYEKWTYYLGMSVVTIPIPFLICLDPPFRFPKIWGPILIVATWYPAFTEVGQTYQCHFFNKLTNDCHGKDFLYLAYYSTALPTLMLFVCASRFWTALAMLIFFVLECALILPFQSIYVRNVVSFLVFSCFILYLHYSRELSDRRMFKLNMQLKIAYRGQQRALASESKANLAKRRFASYVFHEVRVPLNNALLAYQNLQASNALIKDERGEDTIETYALESSLQQMSQILNDVLDFHRMDAGGFESFPQPFCLHRSIRSMLAAASVSAQAKDLTLNIDLDPLFEDVYIVGDEVRLRQVLSNLCSNAIKFTPKSAGAIKVTVRWSDAETDALDALEEKPVGEGRVLDKIVRFEVADRGPGIKPSELLGGRLFQPFVQTKVGKLNGKGTGLGLAIVRQIVALSGGRLGVSSRKDEGCIFWFELPFPLASSQQTDQTRQTEGAVAEKTVKDEKADIEKAVLIEEIKIGEDQVIDTLPPLLSPPLPSPPPLKPGSSTSSSLPLLSTSSSTSSSIPLLARSNIPSPPAGTSSPTSQPLAEPQKPPPKMRILVIDDDGMTRTLMSRMLHKLDCEVETANDGQQAVDAIMATIDPEEGLSGTGKPSFDLICVDGNMPIKSGEEAVRELREQGRTDYIVGCTGNALLEDQVAFRDAGADHVLTKPVMLKDLKAIIETARRRRDERQAPPVPT